MNTVPIEELIRQLCSIPEADFKASFVYNFLKNNPADRSSLEPYVFFSKKHYTRNLVFKNELFELQTLCWQAGQASPIRSHAHQNCWMTVPQGRLRIQNFRLIEQNEQTGYCLIEPADSFVIHARQPCYIESDEPVHQVLNLSEFNQAAVSLHVYSKPSDRSLVYSMHTNKRSEVRLSYSSEYGKLCAGAEL